ncbi:MAG: 1,4-alpha-glucan branching protein domain-containing protein [Sedimentisphaerales bacterium]
MAVGSFCIVLHGHMPYVLYHGSWPNGEDWLYEAAAETYLPILSVIDKCAGLNCNPKLTIGLTPVLLEQLSHNHFKEGFRAYLGDNLERAKSDRRQFEQAKQGHMAYLAGRWEDFYSKLSEQFSDIDCNIPAAFEKRFRQGQVELLTSAATHGYMPLLLEDSSIHAQVRAGLHTSQRILGIKPTGMWLPEGAYRPAGNWTPPIAWGNSGSRAGIERLVGQEGITHFFVDSHLISNGNGETSIHEPILVKDGLNGDSPVTAFARDAEICQHVWCKFVGYPANAVYLEFHKRHGERRGLRYWKITDRKSDLGSKDPYYPDDVEGKMHEHAQHFCGQVKRRLWDYHSRTGKNGVVVACFDTELFGHWWFEGPRFLENVLLTLNADPDVDLCTSQEYLQSHGAVRREALSAGSWGEGGDHRVWSTNEIKWLWEMEYRCETLFGKLTFNLPWRTQPELRKILEKAGRELLLLQASDWAFVISRRQAPEYGTKRFVQHVARFDTLTDIAERLAEDPQYLHKLNDVQKLELKDIDAHDVIFPEIDLNWWNC